MEMQTAAHVKSPMAAISDSNASSFEASEVEVQVKLALDNMPFEYTLPAKQNEDINSNDNKFK